MLRGSHTAGRRRSGYGPQLCAAAAALLLLLSLSVLHSRLSSSPFPLRLPLLPSSPRRVPSDPKPLFDDANDSSTALDASADDRIDELDVLDEDADRRRRSAGADEGVDDEYDDDNETSDADPDGFVWDHALGVARRPFGRRGRSDRLLSAADDTSLRHPDRGKIVFASDDQPVGEDVQRKLDAIRTVEDALLLGKGGDSPLREGWARWLEGKGDFLRRDRMLRSNLELLNPKNHPLLQDPDGPGLTFLTRGDRMVQRLLLKEMEKTPFGRIGDTEVKRAEGRRTLHLEDKKRPQEIQEGHRKKKTDSKVELRHADRRRWGYFPGIDPHLTFSEFIDRFLGNEWCAVRVFMVWNSPPWMFGVRHQRGLESLLHHHRDACVVVLSETMELDFFREFVKEGFKIAVAMPNLDELLKDTPTHVFASLWLEWRKTKHYPVHYSELIRLAVLYKYGGIYLDSDVIVLRPLHSLKNSIGVEDQVATSSTINGAVMAFEKHSPFIMECLSEFYATYDDTQLRWNGADLMTRVMNKLSAEGGKSYEQFGIKIEPPQAFFPINSINITRYFVAPADEFERTLQDALFVKILNESLAFHFWNGLTSALVPETNSLVQKLWNQYCLRCLDVL